MAPAKVKNIGILNSIAPSLKLLGYRNFFVPGGPSASAMAITFGLVSNPATTTTPTEKVISGAPFGPQIDVATFLTRVERSRTFESSAAADPDVRALHSGGVITAGPAPTTPTYAVSTAYPAGSIIQTTGSSGFYFQAGPGGTSGTTAPTWPATIGATVTDNGITRTKIVPPVGLTFISDGNAVATGMLIEIYSNSQAGSTGEIYVAPNTTIRGDGVAAGFTGVDETRLKFSERVLGVGTYTLPVSVGTLPNTPLAGGFLITNVPQSREDAILDSLISGT